MFNNKIVRFKALIKSLSGAANFPPDRVVSKEREKRHSRDHKVQIYPDHKIRLSFFFPFLELFCVDEMRHLKRMKTRARLGQWTSVSVTFHNFIHRKKIRLRVCYKVFLAKETEDHRRKGKFYGGN